jgi:hypothetical protein
MSLLWTNPDTAQNRIATRFVFETRIRLLLPRNGCPAHAMGWTRDLSESGVCAFVVDPLIVDEEAVLEIQLGVDSGWQTIPARVVRSRGTEYGFQFTALSPQQRALIQGAVNGKDAIPYHRTG